MSDATQDVKTLATGQAPTNARDDELVRSGPAAAWSYPSVGNTRVKNLLLYHAVGGDAICAPKNAKICHYAR